MNLNDLFSGKGIDPKQVLVLRHRPREPELRKVLPWLVAERPAGAGRPAVKVAALRDCWRFAGIVDLIDSPGLLTGAAWCLREHLYMRPLMRTHLSDCAD